MSKNQEIATTVLGLIGGVENIDHMYHCMTRLRFNLKNNNLADIDGLKEADGVVGVQVTSDVLQVVIGPSVDRVFKDLVQITGIKEQANIDHKADVEMGKKDFSIKSLFDSFVNTFSACMSPIIPAFVIMGMANVIAALIGPAFFNLVSTESNIYTNFYYMGQAVVYFLPMLAAYTASRRFGTNTVVSMVMVAVLLLPDMATALGSSYTIYGIPVPAVTYNGQLIAVLLMVWIQSYVEMLLKKIIPDFLNLLLFAFCTVAIMLPLALVVLGPIGHYIGTFLADAFLWLRNVAGPVETMLVTAAMPFMTAFGIAQPIFFVCLAVLMATGSEFAFLGSAVVLNNWIAMAVGAGFIIKTKSKKNKQFGITSFLSCFLGGVSEPTLFGIILPNKKTFLPIIVGGLVSGFYLGIMNVGFYQFAGNNFLNVLGFSGGDSNNLLHGCIAAGLAFVVTFVMMLLTYKDTEETQK